MSANFDKCFSFVIGEEGNYTDDPRDNGGATKYGITLKTLAAWRHPQTVTKDDVKNLTLEEAKLIYEKNYWRLIQGDSFPFIAALMLFDAAVNSGPAQAVIWLQRALGVTADGACGPATLAAWKACEGSKFNPPEQVLANMGAYRLMMMAKHEDFDRFGKGWFSRVVEVALRAANGNTGG